MPDSADAKVKGVCTARAINRINAATTNHILILHCSDLSYPIDQDRTASAPSQQVEERYHRGHSPFAMASVTPFARRTNSSTSLAQFYQEHNSNFNSGQDDGQADLSFCNACWGDNDAGYEVLMARLRATGRTMDDMKAFWKERWVLGKSYIEE